MRFLYLLINVLTIFIPLIFSFHRKIRFDRHFKGFLVAAIPVATVFIAWDSIFTSLGIWYFNPGYIIGSYIFNLPVEEVLFFICIPFSCVFTFHCLNRFFNMHWNDQAETLFCLVFSSMLIVIGIKYLGRLYTSVTFISTGLACLCLKFVCRVKWFGAFVYVYALLLLPFLLVNGLLTGTGIKTPVVSYNDAEIIGVHLLTIPIEDVVYGFELILLILSVYLFYEQRLGKKIANMHSGG